MSRQGIVHATVVAPDLDVFCAAYAARLHLQPSPPGVLAADEAAALDLADLAGRPVAWLANRRGQPVLQVIEDPQATLMEPMFRHGWLSLEVLVGDIDALAAGLSAPFRVLGAPGTGGRC